MSSVTNAGGTHLRLFIDYAVFGLYGAKPQLNADRQEGVGIQLEAPRLRCLQKR